MDDSRDIRDIRMIQERSPLHLWPVYSVPLPPQVTRALPSMCKPETYLASVVSEMIDRLTKEEQHGLHMAFAKHLSTLSLASFCAGTDSPALVLDTIVSVINEKLVPKFGQLLHPVSIHAFLAEESAPKREFLKKR